MLGTLTLSGDGSTATLLDSVDIILKLLLCFERTTLFCVDIVLKLLLGLPGTLSLIANCLLAVLRFLSNGLLVRCYLVKKCLHFLTCL